MILLIDQIIKYMEPIYETILRTLFAFSVLLVLTRIIGKKQLGQMTIFTYITGIVIGNMAAAMVLLRQHSKIIEAIVGLVLWAFLTLIVEYISLKSSKARIVLNGEPTIVIKKGQIVEHQLRKQRLNIDDLTMLLRTNNVFSIVDVDYAILESNGDLSILKKTDTAANPNGHLPTEIIVDGEMIDKNLLELGKTEKWVKGELKKQGVEQVKHVLYAELQADDTLYVQKKK